MCSIYYNLWIVFLFVKLLLQILICRNEAEKCLIETSINSLRISLKVNIYRPSLDAFKCMKKELFILCFFLLMQCLWVPFSPHLFVFFFRVGKAG